MSCQKILRQYVVKNNRDLLKDIYSNLKCRGVKIFQFQTLKFPRFSEDIKNMQIEFSGCGMYAFTFKFPFGYTIANSVQPCYTLRWHRKAYFRNTNPGFQRNRFRVLLDQEPVP